MYVIEGYKHLEIAEALNIPVATSKSRLSKARALLQKKLKKTEDAIICSI
jgi:RNA polymerase sigma-70 factor (ECF subfamily)